MDWSDAETVAKARAGDTGAFRTLVERYSLRLFRASYRMLGNQQDAEDVVQETFLRAFRQMHLFDGRSRFGTWLHQIGINYARDLMRARKNKHPQAANADTVEDRQRQLRTTQPGPDRLAFSSELKNIIEPALGQLTEMERSAFVLRHYEEMSIQEISGVLGVQPNSAKQSVFRAVQKLRRALQPAIESLR